MTMRRGLSASCVSEAFKNGLLSNSNGPSSLHNSSDLIKPRKEKSRYEEDFLEIEKLGRGGYGAVYKVQNTLDGLFYALKKIQFKNTSSQLLEKVLREVKTLALLNHPNIVRYHSAWKEEEEPLTIYPDLNPSSDDHVPSLSNAYDDPSEWSDSPDYSFSSDSMEQFNLKVEEDLKKPTRAVPSPPMRLRRRSSNGSMVNVTTLYIVMQLYSTTLSQWLETRTEVDARMNLYIFREICKGLQYIHSRGVIHRDLKPGNIFLSRMEDSSPRNNGGTLAVCLGDFGLAIHNGTPPSPAHSPFFTTPSAVNSPLLTSSISSDMSVSSLSSSFPSTGLSESPMSIVSSNPLSRSFEAKKHTSAVGTLTYSSPEQRYKGIYNEKTDIYSLGIIFFELYYSCGTKMEKARVLGELRNRILPSDFLKRYPTESAFILRMMSPNPDDRPSVDEILRHELLADEFATVSRKDIVDMELTLQQQRELIQQQRAYIQVLEDKLARLQVQGPQIAAS